MQDKEGCQLEGEVKLHKVPGNFHISSHDVPQVAISLAREAFKLDYSHKINHLSFGKKTDQAHIKKKYGVRIENELNGKQKQQAIPFGQWMVNYYLDISEAEYQDTTYKTDVTDKNTGITTKDHPIFTGFPYRSMEQEAISNQLPSIIFNLQITPIKVFYTMYFENWPDFLVRMCAIIGGIFAAASIVESALQNITKVDELKVERAKQAKTNVEMSRQQ